MVFCLFEYCLIYKLLEYITTIYLKKKRDSDPSEKGNQIKLGRCFASTPREIYNE